jgi:predicted Holliday junction resolvase-like endonuclease
MNIEDKLVEVRVSDEFYARLEKAKRRGESWDSLALRLIKNYGRKRIADLEQKLSHELEITRKDVANALKENKKALKTVLKVKIVASIEKSKEVLFAKGIEQLVPFISGRGFNWRDCRQLGPMDFIYFNGLSDGIVNEIIFADVKTGNAHFGSQQRKIRQLVKGGKYFYSIVDSNMEGVPYTIESGERIRSGLDDEQKPVRDYLKELKASNPEEYKRLQVKAGIIKE